MLPEEPERDWGRLCDAVEDEIKQHLNQNTQPLPSPLVTRGTSKLSLEVSFLPCLLELPLTSLKELEELAEGLLDDDELELSD